jgi:hypothetical protein
MLPAMMFAGYRRLPPACCCCSAPAICCSQSSICFPGYPLDGGRVLRAILWRRTGDIKEATRMAGICGMLIAAILIIFGVYMVIAPNFHSYFMGFWSVLVGLFLVRRRLQRREARTRAVAKHRSEAMSAPFSIEPDLLISHLIDSVLPLHRQVAFPVAQNRRLARHVVARRSEVVAARTLAPHARARRDATNRAAIFCRAERHPGLRSRVDETKWHRLARRRGKNGELVGFLQNGKFKRRKRKDRRQNKLNQR